MKIRTGFVSNSSSSSYVIVGSYHEVSTIFEKLDVLNNSECGIYRGQAVVGKITLVYDCHIPEVYGINIEKRLEDGERLPDLKKELVEAVKQQTGIDIPLDDVKLMMGESS